MAELASPHDAERQCVAQHRGGNWYRRRAGDGIARIRGVAIGDAGPKASFPGGISVSPPTSTGTASAR